MIYVDSSVVLARLFAERRSPSDEFWDGALVSSRLLQYEVWVRVHARNGESHLAETVRGLLARVAFLELAPPILHRAMEPFPKRVRTLDALHLSSILFLRDREPTLELAAYDLRLRDAARALGVPVLDL